MIRPPRRSWLRSRTPVLLLATLIASALVTAGHHSAAADSPGSASDPRLPTVVNAPGTWSDEVNRPGPVVAVGIAMKTTPVGLFEERESFSYFSTSALDGRSSWLRLPGFSLNRSGLAGGVAVSPDGRWIGWVRAAKRGFIKGWSVRDTVTGAVRRLEVEGPGRVRTTMAELAFSPDSRHLLTSYEEPDTPTEGAHNHQFVAWNLADGRPTVLEPPGFHWLPSLGGADEGVVWSRKAMVFRTVPGSDHRDEVTLPRTVLTASWAPDDAAFAYIGRDKRKKGALFPDEHLYVGATPSTANHRVDLPETSPIGETLAWRDSTHVVLGNYRGGMYVVDVTDGTYETLEMDGTGRQMNTPMLATDMWTEPLRPPEGATGTSDPRRPWLWGALATFILLVGAGALLLRRAGWSASRAAPDEPSGDVSATTETPEAEPVPTVAWAMAWLFLAGQVAGLMVRGVRSDDLPWTLASMLVAAVVVRWFADGVLRARTVRLVVVWIALSAAVCLALAGILSGTTATSVDAVTLVFSVGQLVALGLFGTTAYFKACRSGSEVSAPTVAPLLLIAVATGLLGGMTASLPDGSATQVQIRL